ncbi:hypothetical protein QR680_013616 [Steinernema hermaphroditum]|uniref:RING-type domain-containing protein n=1 Tax=Steinernema hermaphroditum TaxID=289476 RepID=A0AA39I8Q6_9BILA|nr:hypothetical protein QR680_013616 [Steinernema hermaphroditum]
MTDFIHCNACVRLPSGSEPFFVGTCNMCILCQRCVSTVKSRTQTTTCLICKKPTKFIKISGEMPPTVMPYFRDPKQLCEQFLKQLKQILDFRNAHRTRLIRVQQAQFKRYATEFKKLQEEYKKKHEGERAARQELQHYQEQMKGLKRKLEEDEREMVRLRELVQQSHQFTPKRRHAEPEFFIMNTSEQNTTTSESLSGIVAPKTPDHQKNDLLMDITVNKGMTQVPLTTPAMLGLGTRRTRSRSQPKRSRSKNQRSRM